MDSPKKDPKRSKKDQKNFELERKKNVICNGSICWRPALNLAGNKKYLQILDRLAAFRNVKTTAEPTEQIKFYQNNNEHQTQGTMQ